MLDYFSNDTETVLKKREKKKKLHELLDKYGSVEEIEKNAIGADGYEYMFANTNNLVDEVLKERRSGQSSLSHIRQETSQKRNKLLPDDEDFSLDGLTLSERQRKAIKNLDMTNQLMVIKALREQQNVEKPHMKTEREVEKMTAENKRNNDLRIHKAPKQYASNEYAETKSDADKKEELKIDYSKYGNGFTKGFIDIMLNDTVFQKAMLRTKLNEGGYINDKDDRGGETNMGITKKYYPDEDIKNLTRERANAILYRDYWLKYKINTLPAEISDIVFDDAVVQGPGTAIKNLQKALKVKADGIIGPQTLNALKEADYQKIKKQFSDNANAVEDEYQKNDASQKKYEKGHRNRYNNYY